MAKKKKSTMIRTQQEVLNKLGIKNIKELKEDEGAQKRFVKMSYRVSPEIIKKVIDIVPSLTEVYSEVIRKSSDIAQSLEETIRFRWQALVDIANTGLLTGDQIIEAMRILADREGEEEDLENTNENYLWNGVDNRRHTCDHRCGGSFSEY